MFFQSTFLKWTAVLNIRGYEQLRSLSDVGIELMHPLIPDLQKNPKTKLYWSFSLIISP